MESPSATGQRRWRCRGAPLAASSPAPRRGEPAGGQSPSQRAQSFPVSVRASWLMSWFYRNSWLAVSRPARSYAYRIARQA